MKYILCAAMLASLTGCGSSQVTEPTPAEQQTEQSYAEALQVYRLEKETWNELQDDRQFFSESVDRYNEGVEQILDEYSEDTGGATASAEMRKNILEGRSRARKQSEKDVAWIDGKIAKQKAKLDRAKADLEAAESRRGE